ncbi:hypothetical protein ACFL6W_03800 [Thermodesulfobacteriota bacterium]
MYSTKLPFLQISPQVWADKNCLYARTSIFYRFLCLFFYSRTVVIDRIKKHIEIKIKTLWFFTSKKYIAFSDIKYIDLEKKEKNMFALPKSGFTTEILYVRVIRINSPYLENLFRFIGDSGSDDHWGHIKWFDFVGTQYEKALSYADLVSKYTESQLFKDNKIEYNIKVEQYKCLKCGHVSPSKIKCIYCGNQTMEKVS